MGSAPDGTGGLEDEPVDIAIDAVPTRRITREEYLS
jgi:hypothetical protein